MGLGAVGGVLDTASTPLTPHQWSDFRQVTRSHSLGKMGILDVIKTFRGS